MENTTLNQAKKYGISKTEIEEFALEYGYQPVRWVHIKRNSELWINTQDYLEVKDTDNWTAHVSLVKAVCPVCGEKVVAWGWSDGEIYYSLCDCKVIDVEY